MRFHTKSLLIAAVAATSAAADTITLSTGAIIEGTVTQRPDGLYSITAGPNTLIYRPDEVTAIEKNNRTGVLSWEEVRAQAEAEERRLTEETGLPTELRNLILALCADLHGGEEIHRNAAMDKLAALQRDRDIYPFCYRQFWGSMSPAGLEVLYLLDPRRGIEAVREHAADPRSETRARALEILGKANHTPSRELVARGLADPSNAVRISAAYALAALNAREATPALIESLTHPDMLVHSASREALHTLWRDAIGERTLQTVDEWNAVWRERAGGISGALQLAALNPLIAPEQEFQNE